MPLGQLDNPWYEIRRLAINYQPIQKTISGTGAVPGTASKTCRPTAGTTAGTQAL